MRQGEFFSHVSAALLHRFPLTAKFITAPVHISVFEPQRAPKLDGVETHELQARSQRVVLVDGMPAIGVEDTWAQLSTIISVTDLVVIADMLVTGDEPYSGTEPPSDRDALERAIARRTRLRGVRSLREALSMTRYGSLSPQETRLRLLLVQSGLPQPALNYRVRTPGGDLRGMVDLAYPAERIAIEYLGDHHRTDRDLFRDDIERRERFADIGWSMLFVTARDLHQPRPLLTRIRAALHRAQPAST
jgi:very-short-patch-repair endonuclease